MESNDSGAYRRVVSKKGSCGVDRIYEAKEGR